MQQGLSSPAQHAHNMPLILAIEVFSVGSYANLITLYNIINRLGVNLDVIP